MDYRNVLATGFLLLCGAVFLHSLKSADASMPVGMQHGQFPFEHFTNCDLPGATVRSDLLGCNYSQTGLKNLLTVPSDRIFVVTGASTFRGYCSFVSNGVPLIDYRLIIEDPSYGNGGSPLSSGQGHLVLQPGSTLDVNLSSYGSCPFYVEGYYAHP